ncbi:MAG: hypothetical protein ACE5E7_11505 [Anaerolineae bacterium]
MAHCEAERHGIERAATRQKKSGVTKGEFGNATAWGEYTPGLLPVEIAGWYEEAGIRPG